MVSPHGTDSSRDWRGISAPATLMRLAAGAGREAQERKSIVRQGRAERIAGYYEPELLVNDRLKRCHNHHALR